MFLPDRYIKGECPNCGAKDQYGDNCEVCGAVYAPTELKNPYSALTGATPELTSRPSTTSSSCRTRAASTSCAVDGWTNRTASRAAARGLEQDTGVARRRRQGHCADWDISRDAPYFGIEIPDAPGKYFYVWLDAPVGYLASLKNYFDKGRRKRTASRARSTRSSPTDDVEQIHFIGKDIVYFHTLFWPAMLQFSGRKVPDNIYVHGFITVSGEKMSKSRGTGIDPLRYLELGMNPEWLRYYIAAKLNGARRRHRLQSRRLHAARQQRPDRQVHQHRQPRRGFHRASASAGSSVVRDDRRRSRRRARRPALGSAEAIDELYEEREFGKALREIMRWPTASTNTSTSTSLGAGQADRQKPRLHDVCTRRASRRFRPADDLPCSRCCPRCRRRSRRLLRRWTVDFNWTRPARARCAHASRRTST